MNLLTGASLLARAKSIYYNDKSRLSLGSGSTANLYANVGLLTGVIN